MQANKRENLYVDWLHYNAKFSGEIAGRILEFLNARTCLAVLASSPGAAPK